MSNPDEYGLTAEQKAAWQIAHDGLASKQETILVDALVTVLAGLIEARPDQIHLDELRRMGSIDWRKAAEEWLKGNKDP